MFKRTRKAVIDEVGWCLLGLVLLAMFIHDYAVFIYGWLVELLYCFALALFLLGAWITDRLWKENPPAPIARFFEMT